MNISFKATNELNTTINKCTSQNVDNCTKIPASFIRLNPESTADYYAINNVADNYTRIITEENLLNDGKKVKNYAKDIQSDFEEIYKNSHQAQNDYFYALTTQTDRFEHIDYSKVIGVAEVWNCPEISDFLDIRYLQVSPSTNHDVANREYRNIGTTILNALKSLFPLRNIYVIADKNVRDFYTKNGFKVFRGNQMIYKVK